MKIHYILATGKGECIAMYIHSYLLISQIKCIHKSYIIQCVAIITIINCEYVTRHEKTGLMYTKYTRSYYCKYLRNYYTRYSQSVSCMRFLTNCCINGEKFV